MYGLNGGLNGGFNVWTWIIIILIVLQWFRVGGCGGPGGGIGPETGLLNNGGLFIIALFLLVACSCFKGPQGIAPIRYC